MIDRAIAIVQQDGVIDFVAECAAKMQLQESSILPVLEAELKEVNKGIENMLNAIPMGIVTDSTKARLESLEADKKRLDASIAKEKMDHPEIPKEYFACWLQRLKSGDKDDPDYRKMITDVFINAVYLTDEGLTFGLNFIDGVETIPLCQWNQAVGSDLLGLAPSQSVRKRNFRTDFSVYHTPTLDMEFGKV